MKKNSILIVGIVAVTIIILSGIGSLVFVSIHNSNQTKKTAEFEQSQINLRKAVDEACNDSAKKDSDFYIPDSNRYSECEKAKKALEDTRI